MVKSPQFETVVKRLLSTPHKPHNKAKPERVSRKGRAKKPRAPNGLKDTPGVPGGY